MKALGFLTPYKTGSKLSKVYALMSDGYWRTLAEITHHIYGQVTRHRKSKVASALRTIRGDDKGRYIQYNPDHRIYRMF